MTWTPAACGTRCSSATPGAAGSRCGRRAWHQTGCERWSCSPASGLAASPRLDWLLAAPGIGALSSLLAFRWTPWIARARLAQLRRRHGRALYPGESASLQVWGEPAESDWPLWRTFLAEQRALLLELAEVEAAAASIRVPVLLIADPADRVVPVKTSHRLAAMLPDASLLLVKDAGHHLPRRAPSAVADAITAFLAAVDQGKRTESRRVPGQSGELSGPGRGILGSSGTGPGRRPAASGVHWRVMRAAASGRNGASSARRSPGRRAAAWTGRRPGPCVSPALARSHGRAWLT